MRFNNMICSSNDLAAAFPRISARRGQVVDLNIDFYQNGVLADPYAIRYVEIYKSSVAPHNLVSTIPVVDLVDDLYPAPVCQESVSSTELAVGKYHLLYSIPDDFVVPDVYMDLWYYFPKNPCELLGTDADGTNGTDVTDCDIDDDAYASQLLTCCKRFWVYPNEWFCNDGLQTVRFGFEPLDQRFYYGEHRTLEVGLMPLPLYAYDINLVNPLIPLLEPTITISTQHCEVLVDNAVCRMGIRQGPYRSNPFVIQYDLDTTLFLRGTYQYSIKITLPDGKSRVSPKYILTIS